MRAQDSWLFLLLGCLVGSANPSNVPVGAGVEVSLEERNGRLVADDVELLPQPRSLKLRGRVERLAPEDFVLLGTTIRFGDEMAAGLATGAWVEAKPRWRNGSWSLREIQTTGVKPSPKLKGTVTGWEADGVWPETLYVDRIPIEIPEGTDLIDPAESLVAELFRSWIDDDALRERNLGLADGTWRVSGSLRQSLSQDEGALLGTTVDDEMTSTTPSLRVEGEGRWRDVRGFAQLKIEDEIALDDLTPRPRSNDPFELELRQLFVSMPSVAGRPVGFSLGKQRLRDDREFLFDDYLDAARLFLYGTQPWVNEVAVFAPVAPLKDKASTWTDAYVRSSWYFDADNVLSVYALARSDTDPRGREPVYLGFSAGLDHGPWDGWLETTLLRGADKGRRQEAWAFDAGAAFRFPREWVVTPWFWAALAHASGDDSADPVSQRFRQTGYEDNSQRLHGYVRMPRYGMALQPELSNLRVATVGMGLRRSQRFSIDLALHTYRQDRRSEDLDGTQLLLEDEILDPTRLDLGHAWDVGAAYRTHSGRFSLTYRWGRFWPSRAFVLRSDRVQAHDLQLRVEF